ncbi:MAG: hypothetical protein JST38_16485 [Bacteroidetes bacterium]|nr:hypothetical protein [Bacteroidota bacterium]
MRFGVSALTVLDQLPTKERIESRSQPRIGQTTRWKRWISYPQRKELKADHNSVIANAGRVELDQLPTKERIESRSQPQRCARQEASGWISYPQRKELKADHNTSHVPPSWSDVGSATHKGKN